MRKLLMLALLALPLSSCGWLCTKLCTPGVPPEPDAPPENLQCHLMDPPQQKLCYHRPPDGSDNPPWLWICDNGASVESPELCPDEPGPEPTPPPGGPPDCGFPQGLEDQLMPLQYTNRFRDVINPLMSELSGCAVGSDCRLPYAPDEWMDMVIEGLCERGYAAGRHRESPPSATDQISVSDEAWCDAPMTQQQIYEYGGSKVRWNSNSNQMDDWTIQNSLYCSSGGVPPDLGGCPAPHPPKAQRIGMNLHNTWISVTTKYYDRGAVRWDGSWVDEYCSATGSPHLWCPARAEGSAQRVPCDRIGVSGSVDGKPVWRSDGPVRINPGNDWQAKCDGNSCTYIEFCLADESLCERFHF